MCPVLRSATAIKMKLRDQAHRQATIKGSRKLLGNKSDQNQDDFAMPCILLNTCYKLSTVVHRASRENERQAVFSCSLLSSYAFLSSSAQINALRHHKVHVATWVCHGGRNHWVHVVTIYPYNIIVVYTAQSSNQECKSWQIKDQKVH